MNLEQYARQAQNAQQPQETQQAHPLDIAAARIDADKYHSLMGKLGEIITDKAHPRNVLKAIVSVVFGEHSQEAAIIEKSIKDVQYPGGYDLKIADIAGEKRILRDYSKKLDEQQKRIAEEITRLDELEQETFKEKGGNYAQDRALIDVLTFCKTIAPRDTLLQEIKTLYQNHRGNPAAMGLLYGSLTEAARREYTAGRLDLVQQQEYTDLKAQILAAAEGRQA